MRMNPRRFLGRESPNVRVRNIISPKKTMTTSRSTIVGILSMTPSCVAPEPEPHATHDRGMEKLNEMFGRAAFAAMDWFFGLLDAIIFGIWDHISDVVIDNLESPVALIASSALSCLYFWLDYGVVDVRVLMYAPFVVAAANVWTNASRWDFLKLYLWMVFASAYMIMLTVVF